MPTRRWDWRGLDKIVLAPRQWPKAAKDVREANSGTPVLGAWLVWTSPLKSPLTKRDTCGGTKTSTAEDRRPRTASMRNYLCCEVESYSRSLGSLKSAVSLMLPWPNWGKFSVFGSPGSKFEAVSSGGNSTSVWRKVSRAALSPSPK